MCRRNVNSYSATNKASLTNECAIFLYRKPESSQGILAFVIISTELVLLITFSEYRTKADYGINEYAMIRLKAFIFYPNQKKSNRLARSIRNLFGGQDT